MLPSLKYTGISQRARIISRIKNKLKIKPYLDWLYSEELEQEEKDNFPGIKKDIALFQHLITKTLIQMNLYDPLNKKRTLLSFLMYFMDKFDVYSCSELKSLYERISPMIRVSDDKYKLLSEEIFTAVSDCMYDMVSGKDDLDPYHVVYDRLKEGTKQIFDNFFINLGNCRKNQNIQFIYKNIIGRRLYEILNENISYNMNDLLNSPIYVISKNSSLLNVIMPNYDDHMKTLSVEIGRIDPYHTANLDPIALYDNITQRSNFVPVVVRDARKKYANNDEFIFLMQLPNKDLIVFNTMETHQFYCPSNLLWNDLLENGKYNHPLYRYPKVCIIKNNQELGLIDLIYLNPRYTEYCKDLVQANHLQILQFGNIYDAIKPFKSNVLFLDSDAPNDLAEPLTNNPSIDDILDKDGNYRSCCNLNMQFERIMEIDASYPKIKYNGNIDELITQISYYYNTPLKVLASLKGFREFMKVYTKDAINVDPMFEFYGAEDLYEEGLHLFG